MILDLGQQLLRYKNMPKENITEHKSQMDNKEYESLRYEGFGPYNTALIIETLMIIKIDLHQV